jgi:hypothetical protein
MVIGLRNKSWMIRPTAPRLRQNNFAPTIYNGQAGAHDAIAFGETNHAAGKSTAGKIKLWLKNPKRKSRSPRKKRNSLPLLSLLMTKSGGADFPATIPLASIRVRFVYSFP